MLNLFSGSSGLVVFFFALLIVDDSGEFTGGDFRVLCVISHATVVWCLLFVSTSTISHAENPIKNVLMTVLNGTDLFG